MSLPGILRIHSKPSPRPSHISATPRPAPSLPAKSVWYGPARAVNRWIAAPSRQPIWPPFGSPRGMAQPPMGPNCPGLITRSFVGTDRFRCHSRTHSDTRSGHQRGHCRGASGRGLGETRVDPAQPAPDWRWGHEGSASPWYPTAQLHRRASGQTWPQLLKSLLQAGSRPVIKNGRSEDRPLIYRPRRLERRRREFCGNILACASIAVPDCTRML